LEDAKSHVEAVGGLGAVAGGEAEAVGLGVVADAVFDPAVVLLGEEGLGEVAGTEDPLDGELAGFVVAGDGEGGGRVGV
jgi:hypothetical protein